MHSFEVHSNESVCRNGGHLGLDQVIEECRLRHQPLVSLLRLSLTAVSVQNRPPRHLCPISFVTTAIYPLPFRHQQVFLVVNHRVHHHIESGGRQWVVLGDPSLSAEGYSVVPSSPRHHLHRSWRSLGPTPYPFRITSHLDLSKASWAFCRSRNIAWRTASIKVTTCWSSLTSRVTVPVPWPARNLWRESW